MPTNFDTEIEKLAYEFCVNWLNWNVAFTEYRDNSWLQQRVTAALVNAHKEAADGAMLDLFKLVGDKYNLPEATTGPIVRD